MDGLWISGGDGCVNGWSVNKGGRGCGGGRNANQVSTSFGITQGCVVLVAWFVGCLVGYQCKASIDSIWGKRLVAWFVGCLVGLLAWPGCCLVGWSVGWHSVDGCMDGRMLCKWGGRSASPAMQTKPPPHGISSTYSTWGKHGVMWFGCLACWLLGWLLAWPRCCLVGWSVGWHSVDGWMHGWMDRWILCCLTFRRRPGQFPAVPVVPDSLYAVSGGFPRASNKKLLR